jgi:hypothetical protein
MSMIPLLDLRRVAATLDGLHGRAITDASLTADLRQLRLTLDGGEVLVIRIEVDERGRPHLEVDAARRLDPHPEQLEVRFGA